MEIVINKDKISNLLKAFNLFTGITVSLFDAELNFISDAGKWQPYCLAIGEHGDLLKKCESCNAENAHIALSKRKTHIYTCHAGLVEIIEPIFVNNILIAYIMLGKFRDAEQKYSSPKIMADAVADYNLDMKKLAEAYDGLILLDETAIQSAIILLKTCVSYLIMEKHIVFDEKLSKKIDDYVSSKIKDPITVEMLCDTFYISRRSLYSVFKNDFGCTVKEYITEKRLEKAKELLLTTDLSVGEIVDATGFCDYNYFIKLFKSKTGLPPHRFKKVHLPDNQ